MKRGEGGRNRWRVEETEITIARKTDKDINIKKKKTLLNISIAKINSQCL